MPHLEKYEAYNIRNWDGYDADPIVPKTLEIARALAGLFDKPPEAAPGGDGTIGFEWVDFEKGHKVFLDVAEGFIHIYVRIGNQTFVERVIATGRRGD